MRTRRILAASFGLAAALCAAAPPLRAEIVVGGRVDLAGKIGPERASAELIRILDPYEDGRRRLRGEGEPVVDRATPDAMGLFTLTAPELGLYRVRVQAPGHAPDQVDVIPLVEPFELPRFRLPQAQPPVEFRVLSAGGEAVRAPRVSLVDGRSTGASPTADFSAIALLLVAGDGVVRAQQVDGVEFKLEIAAPGHVARRIEVSQLTATLQLAQLPGAAEREIVAVDADGRLLSGVLLVDGDGNPIALTGEDGSGRCILAPGETVHLLAADGRQGRWTAAAENRGRATLAPGTVLSGTVLGANGATLREAWVGAQVRDPAPRGVAGAPRPLAVHTDANGRYALPVDAETELWVWANAAGYTKASRVERIAGGDSAAQVADFNLLASTVVEGLVVDDNGAPIVGAELELGAAPLASWSTRRSLESLVARSREGGSFSFAAVPATVAAEVATLAPGFAPSRTPIQSPGPTERLKLVIRLDGGTLAKGRVVDRSGAPIAGAAITLERSDREGRMRRSPSPDASLATADESGAFTLSHLEAGLYRVEARATGYSTALQRSVAVSGPQIELGDIVLGPSVELAGRVGDESGSPIAGAVVGFGADRARNPSGRDGGRQPSFGRELGEEDGVLTDAEGRFRLTDLTEGEPLEVYADAPGYGVRRVPGIVVPFEGELSIELRRAGSLVGRVVDREGEPIRVSLRLDRGASLSGEFSSSGEHVFMFGHSAADGSFEIKDLAPGEWRLEIKNRGYRDLVREGVAITGGEVTTTADLVLEREETAVVRGTVSDRSGAGVRSTVHVEAVDRQIEVTDSDASGAYVLSRVPLGPGEIVVQRDGGGGARASIDVVAGENLQDFVLEGAVVEGRVTDESGVGVAGAAVMLHSRKSGGNTTSGMDGSFRLLDIAAGPHYLNVRKEGWANGVGKTLDVPAEGVTGLEIVLTRGAVIRGRLLGLPESELTAVSIEAHGTSEGAGEALANGFYQVTGVLPGPWIVVGVSPRGRQARREVYVSEDEAVALADLDFSEPGFALRGVLSSPDGPYQDAYLLLRSAGDDIPRFAFTDHQGAFLFAPLPAGVYVLELRDRSGGSRPLVSRTLTIDADQQVVLTVPAKP